MRANSGDSFVIIDFIGIHPVVRGLKSTRLETAKGKTNESNGRPRAFTWALGPIKCGEAQQHQTIVRTTRPSWERFSALYVATSALRHARVQ